MSALIHSFSLRIRSAFASPDRSKRPQSRGVERGTPQAPRRSLIRTGWAALTQRLGSGSATPDIPRKKPSQGSLVNKRLHPKPVSAIVKHPDMIALAARRHATDNTGFLDAVTSFKSNASIPAAQTLVAVYIHEEGDKSINISGPLRNEVKKALADLVKSPADPAARRSFMDALGAAQKEIERVLTEDVLVPAKRQQGMAETQKVFYQRHPHRPPEIRWATETSREDDRPPSRESSRTGDASETSVSFIDRKERKSDSGTYVSSPTEAWRESSGSGSGSRVEAVAVGGPAERLRARSLSEFSTEEMGHVY